MKDKKPQLTLKELKFLHDEMINEGGEHTKYLLSQLLSMNDKLTSEQILELKAIVKERGKPHKITEQDILTTPGLLADVSEREYRANKDKYRIWRGSNPVMFRKGLMEKIRDENKDCRDLSDSRIFTKLITGKIKIPAGFSADDIMFLPDEDASEEEKGRARRWLLKEKDQEETGK